MSLDKISAEVKALSGKIREKISFDGNLASVPKDLYKETLPEGLDYETVKKVQLHNLDFADATTLAFGELAINHLKDNGEIDSVGLTVNIGKDRVSSEVRRSQQFRNPSNGETIEKKGVIKTQYVSGINAKRDHYKVIQDHVASLAESIFKQ